VGILDKIKKLAGVDHAQAVFRGDIIGALEDPSGIAHPEDTIRRAKEGDVAGVLANPSGVFGNRLREQNIFKEVHNPFGLLPDGTKSETEEGDFGSIEELVLARTPEALQLLQEGGTAALEQSELARLAATQPLEQFTDPAAFNEQQALLGVSGAGAQQQAIENIPVSEFDQELQRRRKVTQLRQANARGEIGSGSTILESQQLAGAQQADIISKRLAQLEPLAAISRGVSSSLSAADEAARLDQAGIISGIGAQQANIRLGAAAPLIASTINQAELSGLRGINRADQQGQIATQLADLAGRFFTSTPPPPAIPPVAQTPPPPSINTFRPPPNPLLNRA